VTIDEAKTKIKKENLSRQDVNDLRDNMEFSDWNILRAVSNDLQAENLESLFKIVDKLAKKVLQLETNHIAHILKDIEQIKKKIRK
jgi:aminoglycoside/choline kinase family phosphotransferase